MEVEKDQIIDNRKLVSETIRVLRFPLMIGVVFVHIYIPNQTENMLVNIFDNFFVEAIVRIPVPLFFFISGFLFFYGLEKFDIVEYFDKLRKRIRRLLIPYFSWGLLAVGIKYIHYLLGKDDLAYLFNDGCLKWIYYVIWDPVNYQLWFVRDLFLMALLSPLIYFCLKRLKILFVLMLGGAWLFWHQNIFALFDLKYIILTGNVFDVKGFDFFSLFFFSFGAWFSLYNKDFILIFRRLFPMAIVLYVFFYVSRFICDDLFFAELFRRLAIFFGLISVVVIAYVLLERGMVKKNLFLEKGSQFIYYYHAIFLMYFNIILFDYLLFSVKNDYVYLLVYLLIPIVTIFVGLGLYKVGMKYMPRVMNFVLGLK